MHNHGKVLAIIPARGGSKRIPNKNLKLLHGQSLVSRALDITLNSKLVNTIVLSSDDTKILKISDEYNGVIPIKRPSKLATDMSTAIEFVQHTISVLSDLGYPQYDIITIIQPTSPLTLPIDVDNTINFLIKTNADSAVSVVKLDHFIHPIKLKRIENNRLVPYLEDEQNRMATHELPTLYVRNGSVYASRAYVINTGKIIGPDCRAYIMPRERSIDINDEIDLLFAEFLLERRT